MNYIWDITIQAKEDNFKKSDLFWEQGKDVSPYYEQSFPSLNQPNIYSKTIEINALYRFEKLFSRYLHKGFLENLEFKNYFYDLVIHFLCEIDLGKGISKETIYLSELEEDIKNGVFGQLVSENFTAFERKDNILPLVLSGFRLGTSLAGFREALTRIYEDALVYQIKDEPKKILVYLGRKQTDKENQKLEFIETMFLPLEYNLRAFWENHFGVSGVSPTLIMGKIELF